MYELKKKFGKLFTSKFAGTGPSSYEKKNLPGRGLTKVEKHWSNAHAIFSVACSCRTIAGYCRQFQYTHVTAASVNTAVCYCWGVSVSNIHRSGAASVMVTILHDEWSGNRILAGAGGFYFL